VDKILEKKGFARAVFRERADPQPGGAGSPWTWAQAEVSWEYRPVPASWEARVAKKKQWHPVFAELLRPLVESHYKLDTNVPVGDAPRQADFVLLRRTRAGPLPVAGLWRDLTPWNVLEFKGPTVSPRDEDLDLLVELGLGIHRRLNEERVRQGRPARAPGETALWYLANRLGRRLLAGWGRRASGLESHGLGVWRWQVLDHPVFLVSGVELPVEEASLPLHLIAQETGETERVMARLVAGSVELWERYGGWLASLHPAAYEEVQGMARQTRKTLRLDLSPIVKTMGLDWVIEQVGAKRVIEHLGFERVIDALGGVDQLWDKLSPEQRRRLKRRAQE
jgi:hypothetical protein